MEIIEKKTIFIRPLQIKDVSAIISVCLSLSEMDRRFFHPFQLHLYKVIPFIVLLSISSMVSKLIRAISPPIAFLSWIAIDAATNKCAGFIYLHFIKKLRGGKFIADLGIVVVKDYKGKGVGSQLMTELINKAYKAKVHKIELTLFADNKAALGLYQRHGFKLVDTMENAEFWDGKYYTCLKEELVL